MSKILLIDCNALAWAAFHAMPNMTHDGKGTEIIYGFLNILFDIQSFQCADNIVFVWDSHSDSKREAIFPAYKAKRKGKYDEMTAEEKATHAERARQFKELKYNVLPEIGFRNIFWEDGYEGDDIMARIVRTYQTGNRIIIVGRDNDLFQLIGPNCSLYDHISRKFIDEEYVLEMHGIYPDMWADVKAIAGCPTDEVPGVPGIGTGYAVKYLLGHMKTSSKLYQRIEDSPDVIALTRRLTTLPFEGTPHYTVVQDDCRVNHFKRVMRKYGLASYLTVKRLNEFRRFFNATKAAKDTGTSTSTEKESGQTIKSGMARTGNSLFDKQRRSSKLGVSRQKR